jgi:hypothetical protein
LIAARFLAQHKRNPARRPRRTRCPPRTPEPSQRSPRTNSDPHPADRPYARTRAGTREEVISRAEGARGKAAKLSCHGDRAGLLVRARHPLATPRMALRYRVPRAGDKRSDHGWPFSRARVCSWSSRVGVTRHGNWQ